MVIKGKLTSTSVLVEHGSTTEIPAPSYRGKDIGLVLRQLIEDNLLMDYIPDISVRLAGQKGIMVSMRLIRAKSLIDHITGIIQVVLRPAAVGFCKDYDQTLSYTLDSKFESNLPQIVELTLGYPRFESKTWMDHVLVEEAAQAS